MQIKYKPFYALSIDELYSLLQLRFAVFVMEQKCFYNDLDDIDKEAIHLLAYKENSNELIGTARVYLTENNTLSHFGRLCLAQAERGNKQGALLLTNLLDYISKVHPDKPLVISAQYWLHDFYQRAGFVAEGDVYDEAGIDHIKMIRA
jgi:ElaA protein